MGYLFDACGAEILRPDEERSNFACGRALYPFLNELFMPETITGANTRPIPGIVTVQNINQFLLSTRLESEGTPRYWFIQSLCVILKTLGCRIGQPGEIGNLMDSYFGFIESAIKDDQCDWYRRSMLEVSRLNSLAL